ncbi:hypothetical protein P7C71_g322, partial [Lecanoromycetidae sp. Uapishka_2]
MGHNLEVFGDLNSYSGSLIFNLCAFVLPALYGTLSKLWIAKIDPSQVVTTDVYTYIGVITEVLNDGLPRAAWVIIGDKTNRNLSSRLSLSYTLIVIQTILGAMMALIFIGASNQLAAAFVPAQVRDASISYVRISSVSALSSAMQVAVVDCTRALDSPDVPLLISSTSFLINILLDLLIISKFHVAKRNPTVIDQAIIRLACDMTSAFAGLIYFIYTTRKMQRQTRTSEELKARPTIKALKVLARPAAYTFAESAVRNSMYLWLVSRIVSLGESYGTAWGVFNTIRWGLIMVPVQALEASTLAFVSHRWGQWRARMGVGVQRPRASRKDLLDVIRPSFVSCGLALIVEIPICVCLSLWGMEAFAYYLSASTEVALITRKMWRNINWCYIFYALVTQLGAILLATTPRWYLYQSLISNFLWVLPWAIVVTAVHLPKEQAWTYYSVVFGGALVFDFFDALIVLCIWARRLMHGKMAMGNVNSSF